MKLISAALLALLLPAFAASQSLVMVGGGLTDGNAPVWNKVVELAGGRGVAKIGIFTTASSDPLGAADYYVDMFVNVYGALSATFIPVTERSNNADDPDVAAMASEQTGFFFGGGDQLRVITALRPNGRDTLVLTAVKDVLRAGGVVGGTSAGTACQGTSVMITGGRSYDALRYGAFPGGPNPDFPDYLSYDENGGLGIMPAGWVLDTHFSERGREGRLIRLLHDIKNLPTVGAAKGFGVDEDTALVITDLYTRPVGTVIGTTGGVFFADVTNVVSNPSPTTDFENVITHFLTLDDSIDMTTGAITFASSKFALAGQEYYFNAEVSGDILSRFFVGEWRLRGKLFFDNKLDDTVTHLSNERLPQFAVTFDRRTTAVGYGGYLPSSSNTFVVSYRDHPVAIREN